nr:MAG TPA_asm: hypothetical protein [Inoviridae sp.]
MVICRSSIRNSPPYRGIQQESEQQPHQAWKRAFLPCTVQVQLAWKKSMRFRYIFASLHHTNFFNRAEAVIGAGDFVTDSEITGDNLGFYKEVKRRIAENVITFFSAIQICRGIGVTSLFTGVLKFSHANYFHSKHILFIKSERRNTFIQMSTIHEYTILNVESRRK